MDLTFIFFVVSLIIGSLVLGTAYLFQNRFEKSTVLRVGVGIMAFGFALLFWSMFTIVQTKEVGVVTINGKPDDRVLHNGWNWKNPMAQVHKFDGAVQTEKYSTDTDDQGDPITVRLFTGSLAQVNVTFQWQLDGDSNFIEVFKQYRDVDNLNKNVVKRLLQQSLNDTFSPYNPYAALIAAQATMDSNHPGTQQVSISSYTDFQNTAMKELKDNLISKGINPISLTIGQIIFDQKTQDNLNNLSSAIAQTQIAIQNEKTATAQASANATLNAQPASPATIEQLCLQASQKVLEDGHALPDGWSCFGPSSAVVTTK